MRRKVDKRRIIKDVIVHDGYIEYPLNNGFYTKINTDDKKLIDNYTWRAKIQISRNGIRTVETNKLINGKITSIIMPRLIMSCPKGLVVDHVNHDTLDNRRENLRVCTYSDNSCNVKPRNETELKGIYWVKHRKHFSVRIMKNGIKYWVGCTKNIQDAIKMYNKKAKELHGEFAYLNKP